MVELLTTFPSIKSSLYRQPHLPTSLLNIDLKDEWTQTTAAEIFLLINAGTYDKILVFATDNHLQHMANNDNNTIYDDGTFYTCPSIFEQLYTLHALIDVPTELSNAKKEILDLYEKENSEIVELYDVVQGEKAEIRILKEHGSNNQLYLTLREQENGVQDIIKQVQDMTLSYQKTDFKFKKKSDIDIKCIGSIEEVRTASAIQYSPVKLQQAQVQPVEVKSILAFRKEIAEQLQIGQLITDVAVTADDKLFLCDFQKGCDNIYVFKINQRRLKYITTLSVPCDPYGIAVLPGTDKAIVTLPYKSYVQFIDTNTLTMDKTIYVGLDCFVL
ncbi:unnamed protein product [Mytilus edulis]|uniref:Uncharacterized protein n=1 Tax=Mytilus edulis TaxID=6550 RepID=A0A8S3UPF4_MYTED|nr:unnamed protein product [Mytilus edulis]